VGYDSDGQCCEDFGYLITSAPIPDETCLWDVKEIPNFDYESHVFDPNFCQSGYSSDETGWVTFRLISKDNASEFTYLTLYNSHNGYYRHGFSMEVGETVTHEGSI
jgi:hypothetical protein